MAERYDAGVVGCGTAATVAALKLAQAGKKVALFSRGDCAAESNDPIGLFYIDAFHDLGATPDGLTPVVDNRVFMLGKGSSTMSVLSSDQREESPVAAIGERGKVNAWLLEQAKAAGVSVIDAKDAKLEMRFDRNNQLQSLDMNGNAYRLRALVLGEGGECLAGDALASDGTEQRLVVVATQRYTLDANRLADRFGMEAGQASAGKILGAAPAGMAGQGWLQTTSDGISIGLSCVVSVFDGEAEAKVKAAFEAMLASTSIKPLLRDANAQAIQISTGPITGYKEIAQLNGNGWVLVGPATRMIDPLRHEASHHEITQGVKAADAVCRAIAIDDTSSRPLSVYRHMLFDSYVVKNLKAQKNAVEDIERDPSLVNFYAEFANRWFAHDTGAGMEDRRERNKAFFKNLRNERPVWEFAMGMRKSLKILRD